MIFANMAEEEISDAVGEEIFTEVVRRYPAIYAKSSKGHRDKRMVENAWKEVVDECKLESVEEAKKWFKNIKTFW